MTLPPEVLLPHPAPGQARLGFTRGRKGTTLTTALASSPLRFLTPRNKGDGAWVYLAGLGGGLVSGDRYDIDLQVDAGAKALLSTQASTKVYRSTLPCSQSLRCRVADDASLFLIPDPVVCFQGARYAQRLEVDLAPRGAAVVLDGYTCGRSARGERWSFDRYESRSIFTRDRQAVLIDAVRLDPAHGPVGARMGRFETVLSLYVLGARNAALRDCILNETSKPVLSDAAVGAASPIGADGAVLRVVATSFERASALFRRSFEILTALLGDDPFARKW